MEGSTHLSRVPSEDSVHSTGGGFKAHELRHDDCVEVDKILQSSLADAGAAESWKQRCKEVFEFSVYFGGAKRLPLEKPVDVAEPHTNGVAEASDGVRNMQLT